MQKILYNKLSIYENRSYDSIGKNGIRLPKLGVVKAVLYRSPKKDWVLKRAAVKQTKSGRYFCVLQFEFEVPDPKEVLPTEENTVGLDYSSPNFYVDHNGYSPEVQHWFRESEKKLGREQRLLSQRKAGG